MFDRLKQIKWIYHSRAFSGFMCVQGPRTSTFSLQSHLFSRRSAPFQSLSSSLTSCAFSRRLFFSSARPALTGPFRPGSHPSNLSPITCPLTIHLLCSHGTLTNILALSQWLPIHWVYSRLPEAKDHRIIKIFRERHPACNE